MTRDETNWLREVLRLGQRILKLIEGIDYETYHSTELPRIGVERYLISLGEAIRAALQANPELGTHIPDARNAIDLRNFLTHAYLHIDDLIVWNVLREELPRLLLDTETVLREKDT
jgi:uncharacterized protein with HEPN domain